jgi:hypothetical protein
LKPHKPRQIAPRLASGERREAGSIALPPDIKAAFRLIAAGENKSMSWVNEQMLIRALGLKRPEYVKRKGERG